jgi:hypothetical protein
MTDISRAELVTPTITPPPGEREAAYEEERKERAKKYAEVEKMMAEAGVTRSEPPSMPPIGTITKQETITPEPAVEVADQAPKRSGFSLRRLWAK